jgi:gliding motility-associated-like protein
MTLNKHTGPALIWISLCFACFFSTAQNLVPNNGFDTYTSCPNTSSQFDLTPPWDNVNNNSSNPDYMNACFSGDQGAPSNFYGYQAPISNSGYYGMITYTPLDEVREYLICPLSSPLMAGTSYSVGFYVSLSDNFKYASDHFGAYLSIGPISGNGTYDALPFNPQIDNPAGNWITDTTNWTLISDVFIANGGENYITIGNFENDLNTSTTIIHPSSNLSWAYYYLDEAFVVPTTVYSLCAGESLTFQGASGIQYSWVNAQNPNTVLSIGNQLTVASTINSTYFGYSSNDTISFTVNITQGTSIDIGMDTILCEGEELLLDVTSPNATYLWHDNSTGPTFNVTQAGTYWVEVSDNNCFSVDTIVVTYQAYPIVDLGEDTTLCEGELLDLDVSTANATYRWQDNTLNSTFHVTQAGGYWVEVSVNNCSSIDTIVVNYLVLPTIYLGKDTTLCEGEMLLLDALTPNATYLWQDNSSNSEFEVSQMGLYWVEVTVNNCSKADSIQVDFTPLPSFNLGDDTSLCEGDTLVLDAFMPNASYLWQDNSTDSIFTVKKEGEYWARVTMNNCHSSDSILVEYHPFPSVNLGFDTVMCLGETLTLNATLLNASYVWQDNSTAPNFTAEQQGIYWVEVSAYNCRSYDTIQIVYDCEVILEFPNVISPNNDGINDLFVPIVTKGVASMNTSIYNRWGNLMFESSNPFIEWNGQDVSEGVYYWIVYYTDKSGSNHKLSGFVSLIK